jgi:hypothetical protein
MSSTSTPLHALTTLNDPTWVEAARALAESAILSSKDLDQQLTFAFRQVLSRRPRESELSKLSQAWEKQRSLFSKEPAAAESFLNVGSVGRHAAIDITQYASLTAVCLAIFNLDEAITRE